MMDFPSIHIDRRWDSAIKPFIIANDLCLYLEDGYITNNGVQAKLKFFYQSENELAHIDSEEAIGAIKNGRVGIGDVIGNNQLQDNESSMSIPENLPRPTSSGHSESDEPSTKTKKKDRPKILTFGKNAGTLNGGRPMPKSKRGLVVSPDVIKHIRTYFEKNGQSHINNEENDKHFMEALYILQPIVKVKAVDLIKLKRKYNSKIEKFEQRSDHTKNRSETSPRSKLFEHKRNKCMMESDGGRKRKHVDISVPDEEDMDDEMNTSSKKLVVRSNADSPQDSVYVESSEEESEYETNMRLNMKSKRKISKPVQNPNRSYSVGEDRVILDYVLRSRHLNQVNGNVLWKELEDDYSHLTNRNRTWHSLRNRFLKSIRLNLRDFHLSTNDLSRLQMATFKGTQKKPTPAIVLPVVITAHSRKQIKNANLKRNKGRENEKPLPIKDTDTGHSSSSTSALNTIDASTPLDKGTNKNNPTYTHIIKEFELQHREDMNSDDSGLSDSQEKQNKRNSGLKFKSYLKKGSRKLFTHRKL